MYQVFADDILIYDDTRQETTLKLVNPKLSISDSAAGSFTMTVPLNNPGYYAIQRMTTTIKILKEGTHFWEGRLLQESVDFYNQRKLTCEGELAYLNDVTLPQQVWSYGSGNKVESFLEDIISFYNGKVSDSRQFKVGIVDVDPFEIGGSSAVLTFERVTNYETVIECINNQLIGKLGGHLRVRHVTEDGADVRYIDYLKEGFNVNSQIIRFGKNLIDFTRSFDATEYATVVIPLGAKMDSEDIPSGESKVGDLNYYLTVRTAADDSGGHASSQAYHSAGSLYIVVDEAVANYGRIERVVHFDDVTNANVLAGMGEMYLTDTQFDTMVIELTALDLHYLNPEMEWVKIGDKIRVISEPHGLDHEFPVTKLDIPLDQPENTKFTLGDEIKMSLTAVSNKIDNEVKEKIESGPDLSGIEDSILEQVQGDVAALMNERLNGYISVTTSGTGSGIHSDALYISDHQRGSSDFPTGTKYWRWNINGLGFFDGSRWKTAMTMDGTILGERIAAGSIHASKLTAGSLSLTTTAGDNYCTISLNASNTLTADDLEFGTILDGGSYFDSEFYVRMIVGTPLAVGQQIRVSSYSYWAVRYWNGSFMYIYGPYDHTQTFTVSIAGDYIVCVQKLDGSKFYLSDFPNVASSIYLGGATSITSANIQINGMVTFTSLDTYLGTAGHTVINGANIMTGTVSADMIDVNSLKVKTVYVNQSTYTTDYPILTSYLDIAGYNTSVYVTLGGSTSPSSWIFDSTYVQLLATRIGLLSLGSSLSAGPLGLIIDPGGGVYPTISSYNWYLGGPVTYSSSGGGTITENTYFKRIYLSQFTYLHHDNGGLKYYDGSMDHYIT